MRLFFIAFLLMATTQSCFNNLVEMEVLAEGVHKIEVKEVVEGAQYVYFRAIEDDEEYWYSTLKAEVKVGETYYYKDPLEMPNFKSKELDRTFEMIYFLNSISSSPDFKKPEEDIKSAHAGNQNQKASEIKIEPLEGAITISELYANKEKYAGKKVIVKGQVVKFNSGIMNMNWTHLQDGTEHEGNFDLTVTGLENYNVGDVVAIEGVVALDKDFGAGYTYELIVEKAVTKK